MDAPVKLHRMCQKWGGVRPTTTNNGAVQEQNAGGSMVRICAALSFHDCHLLCKQRKLLVRQKSQCHPAKEVVHNRLRIFKFPISGPARGLEPSMRELVAEHLERRSMLQGHRDDSVETLHRASDRRAPLCHPDEDFTRPP